MQMLYALRSLSHMLYALCTFVPHIHSLSRACYYEHRQLHVVSRSLSHTATVSGSDWCALQEVLYKCLDAIQYSNPLICDLQTWLLQLPLCCLAHCQVQRLGLHPRLCCGLIYRVSKFDHVDGYMGDVLHRQWHPIKQRIVYRVSALFWRCLMGLAPTYLTAQCRPLNSTLCWHSLPSLDWERSKVSFKKSERYLEKMMNHAKWTIVLYCIVFKYLYSAPQQP